MSPAMTATLVVVIVFAIVGWSMFWMKAQVDWEWPFIPCMLAATAVPLWIITYLLVAYD